MTSINYWPDLVGIPKYTTEMAEWLAVRGHDVAVVTAPPYYPAWRVPSGYRPYAYRRERRNGVHLYRCPLFIPAHPTGARRVLHQLSFAISSAPVLFWKAAQWRPDLVLSIEPPLLASPAALLASRIGGSCSWVHVQDLEVQAAFDLGLLRNGILRGIAFGLERQIMVAAQQVSTISRRMREALIARGIPWDQIEDLPNWVDTGEIFPLAEASPLRTELGFDRTSVIALYAGSMGEKQGLSVIVEVARLLEDHPHIRFVIAGDGPARPRLEALCRGLRNIRFLPLQPAEKLNNLLNLADIHLLPQRRNAADLVMPSKLGGMLASGKPIVATVDRGTQVGEIIERGCGIVVPPDDTASFAEALESLAGSRELRGRLGRTARREAVATLSKAAVLGRFESRLLALRAEFLAAAATRHQRPLPASRGSAETR